MSYFLSLILLPLTVAVEGYGWTWSHSVTRTTVGESPLDEGPARDRDNTRHLQETDIHAPGGTRTRNPSKRAARRPTPYFARPLRSASS